MWLARLRAESLIHHSEEPPRSLAQLLHPDRDVAAGSRGPRQTGVGGAATRRDIAARRGGDRRERAHCVKWAGVTTAWCGWSTASWRPAICGARVSEGAAHVQRFRRQQSHRGRAPAPPRLRPPARGTTGQRSIRRFTQMLQCGVLSGRGIPEVQVTDEELAHAKRPQERHRGCELLQARLSTRARAKAAPAEWGALLREKTWLSQATTSLTASVSAWRWILHCCGGGEVEAAPLQEGWLATLVRFQARHHRAYRHSLARPGAIGLGGAGVALASRGTGKAGAPEGSPPIVDISHRPRGRGTAMEVCAPGDGGGLASRSGSPLSGAWMSARLAPTGTGSSCAARGRR